MEPGDQSQRIRVGNSSKSLKAIFLPAQSWCSLFARMILRCNRILLLHLQPHAKKEFMLIYQNFPKNKVGWKLRTEANQSLGVLLCIPPPREPRSADLKDKWERAGGEEPGKPVKGKFPVLLLSTALCCPVTSQHLKASITHEEYRRNANLSLIHSTFWASTMHWALSKESSGNIKKSTIHSLSCSRIRIKAWTKHTEEGVADTAWGSWEGFREEVIIQVILQEE